jgi:signal transduction histidine kinase
MPAPWATGNAWNDANYGGWPGDRGGGQGAGVPRPLRLWLPVVISFLVQVPAVSFMVGRSHDGPGGYFPVVLAMIGPLALIGARRFPGPVVAVTAVAAAALLLLRPDIGVPPVALIFAIVLGIIRGARVWVYSSVGATWVATIAAAIVFDVTVHPFRIVSTTFGLGLAMAIGEVLRSRRERFRAFRRAADEQRLTVEQRERMRIARELHDVLAHSLSQINVQAGVGLHLIDSQPDKAAEALANIKGASKNALDEVRTVLGILRSDPADDEPATDIDDAPGKRAAPLRPEPDLSSLPALVESFRSHGLEVTFVSTLHGEPAPPAATQLALYRICQEALTNVLRHANANAASVFLGADHGDYLLTVTDDGTSVPPGRTIQAGSGLLGMRERAELLGGTLHLTRPDNGGFQIEARIPRPKPAGSPETGGAPA